MSHAATNWALKQRGLKPAAKIVLLCLADCHNPHYGCFPSQATLADDAEMSRSTLNVHLLDLEARGLIRRHVTTDDRTKRQRPTRYYFAFEAESDDYDGPDFGREQCPESGQPRVRNPDDTVSEIRTRAVSGNQQEPCPESGQPRVRNPDTNPVRYNPVKEPVRREGARERAQSPAGDPDPAVTPRPSEADMAVRAYNAAAADAGWPQVKVLSKARVAALKARLVEAGGIDGWAVALAKARASPFCNGQNNRGWVANFDFFTRQSSFAKLMEGNYDPRTPDRGTPRGAQPGRGGQPAGLVGAALRSRAERAI